MNKKSQSSKQFKEHNDQLPNFGWLGQNIVRWNILFVTRTRNGDKWTKQAIIPGFIKQGDDSTWFLEQDKHTCKLMEALESLHDDN